MSIQVEIKNVYGNSTIYPVCETAKLFAKLVRQKTLSMDHVHILKQLGYSVEVVAPKVSL